MIRDEFSETSAENMVQTNTLPNFDTFMDEILKILEIDSTRRDAILEHLKKFTTSDKIKIIENLDTVKEKLFYADRQLINLYNSDTLMKYRANIQTEWNKMTSELAKLQGLIILKKAEKEDCNGVINSLLSAITTKISTVNEIVESNLRSNDITTPSTPLTEELIERIQPNMPSSFNMNEKVQDMSNNGQGISEGKRKIDLRSVLQQVQGNKQNRGMGNVVQQVMGNRQGTEQGTGQRTNGQVTNGQVTGQVTNGQVTGQGTRQVTGQFGGSDDLLYKSKYLKYKIKYLNLMKNKKL
jgi:hypothetical protein